MQLKRRLAEETRNEAAVNCSESPLQRNAFSLGLVSEHTPADQRGAVGTNSQHVSRSNPIRETPGSAGLQSH